jgi:hypothetical protein
MGIYTTCSEGSPGAEDDSLLALGKKSFESIYLSKSLPIHGTKCVEGDTRVDIPLYI